MPDTVSDILKVDSLETGYEKKRIINGITFGVKAGEIVALIGHNGAGKSTLLKAVFGLLPVWGGSILFNVGSSPALKPHDLLTSGVAYVPQGGRVFTDFTVWEHLEMGRVIIGDLKQLNENIERILNYFPALRRRLNQKAGSLSGGEKQLLALSNVLILSPRFLLLDEPSLGLSPPLAAQILANIQTISRELGVTALIAEQAVREVLKVAQRVVVLRNGSISFLGDTNDLIDDVKLKEVYF